MQEVFSRIIEELEIERTTANNTFAKYEMKVDLGRVFGLERAIEIVKQEAEKYNNGWVPCSERLPENISTVVVQVKEIEKPTFGWFGNMTGWRLTEKDFTELKDFIVVAWQPLPQPYQPKGEMNG